MSTVKPKCPIRGRWRIDSITNCETNDIHADAPAFIEYDGTGTGTFQFGYVRGLMDCRPARRDDEPAVQWTWEGNAEMDSVVGTGWAFLEGDELHGMISFHQGEDCGFVATRVKKPMRPKRA